MNLLWVSAFATLTTITVSSCIGSGGSQKNGAKDSTEVSEFQFSSPDLAMYNLYGPVKRVITSTVYNEEDREGNGEVEKDTLLFSPEGFVLSYRFMDMSKAENAAFLSRNEMGQIISYNCEYQQALDHQLEYWTAVGSDSISYDEYGRMVMNDWSAWESAGLINYTYDAEGNMSGSKHHFYVAGSEFDESTTYTYDEQRDEKGNWLKRKVLMLSHESAEGEVDEDPNSLDTLRYVETRVIEYY